VTEYWRVIDIGDTGPDVEHAHALLLVHGYTNEPPASTYTRTVSLAVRDFQRDRDLPITGTVNRRTWQALQPS